MNNSINFKGAFLVKQPTQPLRDSLLPLLGKRKQIIENMSDNGDVLYVVRNSYDKGIADVLIDTKNAKFKYYPTLNTKSGFDDEKPTEAKSILRSAANKVIDTKQKLVNFFKPKPKKPIDIVKVQADNLKTIQRVTYIDITGSECKTNIDHQNGVCSVYTMLKNRNGKRNIKHSLITITPPDKFGISYARVTPYSSQSSEGAMRRLAIKNGEVIFEYNQPGSKTFIKNEAAAKEHYATSMTKYKEDLEAYNKRG